MGTDLRDEKISSALFGKTRRVVLALFYGHADESFYVRQIVRSVGAGQGAVQRELKRLSEAGLIERVGRGRQVYYQANRRCPVFAELRGLIIKTAGVADVVRAALAPLADTIAFSFLYGSFAGGRERSDSDVDLLVAGAVSFADVVSALGSAQEKLGREVNPTVYSVAEFREKLASGHHFLAALMNGPKIVLTGDEREFAELVEKRMVDRARDKPRRNRQPARRRRT